MGFRSREILFLLALASVGVIVIFYHQDLFSVASDPLSNDSNATEVLVWSSEKRVGQTWANLGKNGRIDYPEATGVDGKGRALTIYFAGEGHRNCGLNWKNWRRNEPADNVSRFASLVFHVRQAGATPGIDIQVSLVDNEEHESNLVSVVGDGGAASIDKTWRKVVLPLPKFTQNKASRLDRLWQINFTATGADSSVIQIDRIGFSMDAPESTSFAQQRNYKARALVDLDRPGHRIGDGIYGVCERETAASPLLPDQVLRDFATPITRCGGNTSTRYNWKINAENGAKDYYFKNRDACPDHGYLRHCQRAQARSAAAYQTVPIIGWVAKDNQSQGGKDPNDTSVAVGPEFIAEAVAQVARECGAGTRYWVLDNEPMLWHETHRDVRSEPMGYDELWQRTVAHAEAIKKADPAAKVAGFCSWGWTDLFYSAKDKGADNYSTKADYQAHGREPLAEWFIRKCGDYRRQHGKPLVDVFDIHWYPQCKWRDKTPYEAKGMDVALNELRLRSTRDLWDPAYTQESWIKNTVDRLPTRVLRRVREWIDRHDPKMELCVGEYNFGGGDNISGGLAQADVFGILAREKVDMAFIWFAPEGTQNLAWKLFRNYDGAGGRFGSESLATASDQPDLAVHAARRADGAVTIAVINKSLGGPCELNLDAIKLSGKMRVWRFDQKSNRVMEITSESATVNGAIRLTLPPASASMLVVK